MRFRFEAIKALLTQLGPIPTYPTTGTGGGDMPLMVVEDEWEGSGNTTRTFTTPCMGFAVVNSGNAVLIATIDSKTIQVDAGESFENLFKPFTSVSISATSTYKALVTAPYNATLTPTQPTAPADTTPPTVTISPAAGTYTSAQSVTLSSEAGATIYYTTDGSTPTTASPVYSGPIAVNGSATIRYFGRDTAGNNSTVQSATYTLNLTELDTTPPTVNISPAAGTYTSEQSVTLSTEAGATIYYTTDGSTPTTSSPVYSSAIPINVTTTLNYFGRDTAGNNSAVQSATYTINLPVQDTTPPVVTASPGAGTYTSAQSVTLSTEAGATIYYTTNGTTPTTSSTQYTGPIAISATTTLQFIGRDSAGNNSTPVAATYTINIPQASGWTIEDNFNRADSTTSLGTATSGQAWQIRSQSGTLVWGINTNQAVYISGGSDNRSFPYINLGSADGTVEIQFGRGWTDYTGVKFRGNADGSGLLLYQVGANLALYSVTSSESVGTQLTTFPYDVSENNDVIRVTFQGSTIRVYANGTQVGTNFTTTFNQTATLVGMATYADTNGRWDNFKASTQVLAGNTQPT